MQNKFKSNAIRIAFSLVFITLFTGCTSLRSQYANNLLENSINWNNINKSDQPIALKTRLNLCILPKLNISPEQDWEAFLKSTNTAAFIVIKDGSIVCEQYSNGSSKDALQNSWSIAKSVISGLVGIALNDGVFQSIDDKITKYLPELIDVDVRYRDISLKNLLEMRSGINFSENYLNPFSDVENLMKSDDLLAYIKTIKIISTPDTKADYQSFNTLLLGLALQRATKIELTDYFQSKIWNPIGATHNAQWLSDKSNNPQYKSFCCIKATAQDFSKFALLYLNRGYLNDVQIIPKKWIIDSAETVTRKNGFSYSMGWWHTGEQFKLDKISSTKLLENPDHIFYEKNNDKYVTFSTKPYIAEGILGQYLYISPEKNLVIARFGKSDGGVNWPVVIKLVDASYTLSPTRENLP